ncbi:hypothetical protein KFL_000670060 [Klebsormidium nitens]|uniref:Uncharacterized protein n=1 Tax=Klebsormidium nitens TaxID=105231 RepID=A0A1Y1HYK5_KLENI|nr:hypothetical protein KFL_000670060 [Klebsormidium nitens]|eukprot:GAQ80948.1 hypothetical protein KFL_000670060 [Klebsormidium nitens]
MRQAARRGQQAGGESASKLSNGNESDMAEMEQIRVAGVNKKETRNKDESAEDSLNITPERRSLRGASGSAQKQSNTGGSAETPPLRGRKFRGANPIGAATVARQMAEIDLRTPETLHPVCIGASQASQEQARLFGSPPADQTTPEGSGRRKGKRQRDYHPLYLEAVERGFASGKKARERQREKDVGAKSGDVGSPETGSKETRAIPGTSEEGQTTALETDTVRKVVQGRGANEQGPETAESPVAEEDMEVPQSPVAIDEPTAPPHIEEAQEVPRSTVDEEGSLEDPQTSGAGEEPLSAHELAVSAAMKLLKGRLLGLDGWSTGDREGRAAGMEEFVAHQKKLYTLLADTVEKGLNVSALLLGPRGGGKSAIVDGVIRDLQEEFQERVTVVRLNGLVHADERTALKEIARQLCEDNDLAISSKTSTFELNLRFLTDILTECVKAHRAVIFVLDEFDLFAQRPKQTLLYNLLDAIQSSKTQAAVVGISCRMDADELLEKRVRSRFSHRRLQVLEPKANELVSILADALRLPPSFPYPEFADRFNKRVEEVLADPDVQSILDFHISRNQSPRHLLDLGFRALCCMDRSRGYLTVDDIKSARDAAEIEPRVESIRGLSVLELYLLIAMKRLEEKERDKYNFNMVFAEYQELRLYNTADVYSRGVSLRAFQHLVGRELVAFADRRPRGDPVEFRPMKLLVTAAEIECALAQHPSRSSVLEQWFAHKAAGKF